ncbi:MAG TPA: mannosyltransferase family protein [Rubrobacteraceae bacterium]|nr:mannosyltransferase family protein [Rubrobacteraceae bacterium]
MEDGKRAYFGAAVFVLVACVASRLFYLAAGALLAATVPVSPFHRGTADVPFGTTNIWTHWDGEHYVMLASDGYLNPPHKVSPAFFPLYPLLVRSAAALFGGPLSREALGLWGVLLSLLLFPVGLYFVYKIAESGWGVRVARASVLLLAFFPTSFFFNAAYTESLFLALSAGSLWAARVRKDLLLACLLAGLATAARNVGVFLLVPLFLAWFEDRERYGWRATYLALAPSGLAAYAAYLWWRFGDPLLFYGAQEQWSRQPTGPVTTVRVALQNALDGVARLLDPQLRAESSLGRLAEALAGAQTTFSLLLLVLAVTLVAVGFRTLPLGLSLYTLLLVAVPISFGTPVDPLMGLPRYLLVAFPIFIVLATRLEGRSLYTWLVASAAVSLVPCALFVTWRFVA